MPGCRALVGWVGRQRTADEIGQGMALGRRLHRWFIEPRGGVQGIWPPLDLDRPFCFARRSVVRVVEQNRTASGPAVEWGQ
jgi:hypothetical protein